MKGLVFYKILVREFTIRIFAKKVLVNMRIILQRYLAYNLIPPFIVATIFFMVFLTVFELFKVMRILIGGEVQMMEVAALLYYIGLGFLPMALPIAILFATTYTMSKLSEDSEIVVMRSLGLSKYRLVAPILIMSLVIAASVYSLNDVYIPNTQKKFREITADLSSKSALAGIKSQEFFTELSGITLYADNVSNDVKDLSNVFIRFDDNDESQIIFAQSGELKKQHSADGSRILGFRLSLNDGNITKFKHKTTDVEKIIFQNYDFPIQDKIDRNEFSKKNSMKTNEELLSFVKLPLKEKTAKMSKRDAIRVELEYWNRLNGPILICFFAFLGFTLGTKKSRGKSGNASAQARSADRDDHASVSVP